MARRKNYRKKRRFRKKRKTTLMRSPVPLKMVTKLRYVEQFTIDPGTAGINSVYIFSANGLFDPNITSTGHQPRGFDQLMALYDHYVVLGSKITVHFGASTGTDQVVAALALRDGTGVATNQNNYLEDGSVSSVVLANNSGRKLTKTFSNKFLGRSHPLADPHLKGDTTSNPTEQGYYHISLSDIATGNPTLIECYATIDYIVAFIEPNQPGQS